jgi:hypothetical protein
MKETFQ